jgi:hypothetical protein
VRAHLLLVSVLWASPPTGAPGAATFRRRKDGQQETAEGASGTFDRFGNAKELLHYSQLQKFLATY